VFHLFVAIEAEENSRIAAVRNALSRTSLDWTNRITTLHANGGGRGENVPAIPRHISRAKECLTVMLGESIARMTPRKQPIRGGFLYKMQFPRRCSEGSRSDRHAADTIPRHPCSSFSLHDVPGRTSFRTGAGE
jgi:hypothetical protein